MKIPFVFSARVFQVIQLEVEYQPAFVQQTAQIARVGALTSSTILQQLIFLLFTQLNSKSTNGKDFKNTSTHVLGSLDFIIQSAGKPYARCVEERTLCQERVQV